MKYNESQFDEYGYPIDKRMSRKKKHRGQGRRKSDADVDELDEGEPTKKSQRQKRSKHYTRRNNKNV